MSGMEFTWRMVGAVIWPVVVLAGLIAYQPWITKRLESLRFKAAGIEGEVKVLNVKVDTIGLDISTTLSEMPHPIAGDEVPTSLVDLIPVVTRNRSEGLQVAFELVVRALRASYPKLDRVPPSQLKRAMDDLVDRREMEADVAASVRQLQELLEMPEWGADQVGDTRGYAFLMLAEGAIHEILRTAQHRVARTANAEPSIAALVRPSWRGTYDGRFPVELRILGWDGTQFSGIMTYPDGDTVTTVSGQAKRLAGTADIRLAWREIGIVLSGRRNIDLNGSYTATVSGGQMDARWLKDDRVIVSFEMEASETSLIPG